MIDTIFVVFLDSSYNMFRIPIMIILDFGAVASHCPHSIDIKTGRGFESNPNDHLTLRKYSGWYNKINSIFRLPEY